MFKRRKPLAPLFILLAFIILIGALFIFVDFKIRPTIFAIAEARAIQMATDAVNRSIREKVVEEGVEYQDFVKIHKDNQGRVALMQANTVKVNQVTADITLAVQKALEELKGQQFGIPLGQVSGTQLLAPYGPRVKVRIIPVGTVKVEVMDKFEQAGINQTRHLIYLAFDTMVRIVIPSKGAKTKIANQVPLAESIIVGEVPSTYVSLSSGLVGVGIIK